MTLDIRIPMGLMFTTLGVVLTGFGFFSDRAIYARSLGININLWWGLLILALGVLMLLLARFGRRSDKRVPPDKSGNTETTVP